MFVEVYESKTDNSIAVILKGAEPGKGGLDSNYKLLREIEGIDWEDCMKKHHELMGWEPYVPFTA